jgi:hypothetical protein
MSLPPQKFAHSLWWYRVFSKQTIPREICCYSGECLASCLLLRVVWQQFTDVSELPQPLPWRPFLFIRTGRHPVGLCGHVRALSAPRHYTVRGHTSLCTRHTHTSSATLMTEAWPSVVRAMLTCDAPFVTRFSPLQEPECSYWCI